LSVLNAYNEHFVNTLFIQYRGYAKKPGKVYFEPITLCLVTLEDQFSKHLFLYSPQHY